MLYVDAGGTPMKMTPPPVPPMLAQKGDRPVAPPFDG